MKILFVYNSISPIGGGSQKATLAYLKQLTKLGVECKILTSRHSVAWLKSQQLNKNQLIANTSFNYSFLLPMFYPSFWLDEDAKQAILDFNPNLIQLNEPSLLDLALIRLAKQQQIKIGGFFHTNYQQFSPRWLTYFIAKYREWCFQQLDFILFPSRNFLKSYWAGQTVYQVKYPIDSVFFNQQNTKKIPRSNYNLVTICRLSPEKKIDLLLATVKLLPPEFHLTIIGDGREKNKISQQLASLGLKHRVKLTGHLTPSQIKQLLSQSSLAIFPSRSETFGLVYIETLAAGVPILVADYSIAREVIPASTAVFIKSNQPQVWADQISQLINNQRQYESLIKNIQKHYQMLITYREDKSGEYLLSIYQQIIGSTSN